MPFEALAFTDPLYHAERLKTVSWLDKVASFLLAVNWSEGQGGAGGKAKTKQPVETETGDILKIKNRQFESHLDCVAVVPIGGAFYFAANTLTLSAENVLVIDQSFAAVLPEDKVPTGLTESGGNTNMVVPSGGGFLHGKYEIVTNGGDLMHAEMKLVHNAKAFGRLVRGTEIGVSKPCCNRCKVVLDKIGWVYTSFHSVPVPENRWLAPELG
jgi:hypothetical protein